MNEELNYLSIKIEDLKEEISSLESMINEGAGGRIRNEYIKKIKHLSGEIELLENILNALTLNALS